MLAVYLGVENYGTEETNRDNLHNFRYRFLIDDQVSVYAIDNGVLNTSGDFDYPVQNTLKEGYAYDITVEGHTVAAATEADVEHEAIETPVTGTPGELTLTNFLKTSLMPVGTALYVYGGGWNWQDTGSAIQTRTLGVSRDWVAFFEDHDTDYTYKDTDDNEAQSDPTTSYFGYGGYNEYYYAGLDCSGFVGWALYNTFETQNGREGYVCYASTMAKGLADRGWGTFANDVATDTVLAPGSVVSTAGHVWISLGTCPDGSVVIAHSTPSPSRTGQPGGGVQIASISEGATEDCDAYRLAKRYMSTYYPAWYARYEASPQDRARYLTFDCKATGVFVWDTEGEAGLKDPDGIQGMSAEEALEAIFSEAQDQISVM